MILMRTLRKDYARYSKEDEIDDMERDLGDEYGWKQVGIIFDSLPKEDPVIAARNSTLETIRCTGTFSGLLPVQCFSLL